MNFAQDGSALLPMAYSPDAKPFIILKSHCMVDQFMDFSPA